MDHREHESSTELSVGRRVLLVTPQPFYEDRGTPIAVRFVSRALGELGYDVDLLAFPIGQTVSLPRVTIWRSGNPLQLNSVSIGFSWKKALLDASLWQSFRNRLRVDRYDVVHAFEEAAYLASNLCPSRGVPFIYDMASAIPVELRRHAIFRSRPMQSVLSSIERAALNRASHVICSTGLAHYVSQKSPMTPVSEWRFPVVDQEQDESLVTSLRRNLDIAPQDWVLLYTGNFASYQGVDVLFAAFRIALRTAPQLLLVCVGATDAELVSWQRKIDAESARRARIIARRPAHEIPMYLSLADCLVSPRHATDNVPLKIFDYMGSGKPIIATRGRAHEPLLNPERAVLCDATPESLASAIVDTIARPEQARALARTAAEYAHRHFGWRAFVEFIRVTYCGVLERGNCSARLSNV